MGKIKLRNTDRDIKVLNRSSNMSKHMKNAYIKARDRVEESRNKEENAHNNYATEMVSGKAKEISYFSAKKAQQFSRRSAKTAPDTLKKAKSGAVNMPQGIKGTMGKIRNLRVANKTAVKITRQATKSTKKASQKATQAASTTARATKDTFKTVVASVKASIEAAKHIVALIAAAGWTAVVIILVVCMATLVVFSFFGNEGINNPNDINIFGDNLINTNFSSKNNRIFVLRNCSDSLSDYAANYCC